jgi:DNA mismatch repair ATPase MutS
MLIIPFFILKIQRISISINTYINTLLKIIKNHIVGKAISEFTQVGWDKKFYIIISVAFYFINIYQNIISCYTFYKNIYKIRTYLLNINNFLTYSIESINNINQYCKKSYIPFYNINSKIKEILSSFSNEISIIRLETISIRQIGKIGNILCAFYQLFKNKIYKKSLIYALYLQGFIQSIIHLQKNIAEKSISYCKFTKKNCTFSEAYFASLINNNPIKNTYTLNNNILITGPNAAGKTTMLKTTLYNIILSQQLGIGFYKRATINPYKYIHSYINIPDTSERDSLFQAEARRCKEILDCISSSTHSERHFCIFDEIYSGTNPAEAIASAYSFLKYISNKNIDYVLTTHYVSLCEMMEDIKRIDNKQMEVNNLENTYKLTTGISNIKGGIKVLEELGYNEEIIDSAKKILKNIPI